MRTRFAVIFLVTILVGIFATLCMMFSSESSALYAVSSDFSVSSKVARDHLPITQERPVGKYDTFEQIKFETQMLAKKGQPAETSTNISSRLLRNSTTIFHRDPPRSVKYKLHHEVEPQKAVLVAVCFAGAWRRWDASWASLKPNLIEALDADVFAVSDAVPGGANNREQQDLLFTQDKFHSYFGKRLVAAEHITADQMKNTSMLMFQEIREAQEAGLFMFPYYFKIWRCGQLIHRHVKKTGIPYDVVIRLRPDLSVLEKWKLSHTNYSTPESPSFRLSVGPSCAEFGQRDIVMGSLTYFCVDDRIQVGTYASMTVLMDLARFVTPHSAFLSSDPAFDLDFVKKDGGETALNWLAWRTGTRIIHVALFVVVTRQLRCSNPNCYPSDPWFRPDQHLYECQSLFFTAQYMPYVEHLVPKTGNYWFDCSLAGYPEKYLEYHPSISPFGSSALFPSIFDSSQPPRNVCGNVSDLAVHNPLGKCKGTGGPLMKAVHVEMNYGTPFIFDFITGHGSQLLINQSG
jgi:hypothetical protein